MKSALEFLYSPKNKRNPICVYILKYLDEPDQLKIKKIASFANVSESSIVRFFKRNQFNGFIEFKHILIYEQSIKNEFIVENSDLDRMYQNIKNLYQLNSDKMIELVTTKIINAKFIIILAIGNTNSFGLDFNHKLLKLGIHSICPIDLIEKKIWISNAPNNSLVFVISFSDETEKLHELILYAKDQNLDIISLTQPISNQIKNLADLNLFINFENSASSISLYRYIDMEIIFYRIMTIIFNIEKDKSPDFYFKNNNTNL